jgi:hypothetical protein
MRQISTTEVLHVLDERKRSGHHIDQRVYTAVAASAGLFLLTLADEASFLSLVWQQSDGVRLLVPRGRSRTLRDVAQRMIAESFTFERLASDLGRPKEEHDPEWFRVCTPINASFDLGRFGWVTVVPASDSERKESPGGSLYIFDGVHKTLVLSKRLVSGETQFRPVEALLILPRPD